MASWDIVSLISCLMIPAICSAGSTPFELRDYECADALILKTILSAAALSLG